VSHDANYTVDVKPARSEARFLTVVGDHLVGEKVGEGFDVPINCRRAEREITLWRDCPKGVSS
jgi:hypothetical protein